MPRGQTCQLGRHFRHKIQPERAAQKLGVDEQVTIVDSLTLATTLASQNMSGAPVNLHVSDRLQQLLQDVVNQLGEDGRKELREFVQDLKAKRETGEIPSLTEALLRGGEAVVGAEVWRRACERQGGAEVWHRARSQAGRTARDAAFVRRTDLSTVASSDVWRAVFSFTDVKGYCGVASTSKMWSVLARDGSTIFFTNALAKASPAAMMQLSAYPVPATAKTYIDLYQRFERLNVGNLPAVPAYNTTRQASDYLFTVEVIDSRRREVLHACTATLCLRPRWHDIPDDEGRATLETERVDDTIFELFDTTWRNEDRHFVVRLLCLDKITRRTCALVPDADPVEVDAQNEIFFSDSYLTLRDHNRREEHSDYVLPWVHTHTSLHRTEQRFQFYCENCGDSLQLDDFLKLLEHHALFF